MTNSDIAGYWKLTIEGVDGYTYVQFTDDFNMVNIGETSENTRQKYDLQSATSSTIDITFVGEDGSGIQIEKIENEELRVHEDGDNTVQKLTRTSKDEVDKYLLELKAQAEASKPVTTNANTPEDAIKIVESLAPGNYTAFHDGDTYDITTMDGAYYFYISYTAASGMGGELFVRKGTDEVYGVTLGTEDDPNAPFPDFSNQIQ